MCQKSPGRLLSRVSEEADPTHVTKLTHSTCYWFSIPCKKPPPTQTAQRHVCATVCGSGAQAGRLRRLHVAADEVPPGLASQQRLDRRDTQPDATLLDSPRCAITALLLSGQQTEDSGPGPTGGAHIKSHSPRATPLLSQSPLFSGSGRSLGLQLLSQGTPPRPDL